MEPGRISIIIPTFNTPTAWLDAALASARSQTYKNVEIVVVDDGSDTPVVVDGVHLVRQDNQGAAAALARGTALSTGEFVLAMGADDMITPDTLTAMHHTLVSEPDCVIAYPTVHLFGAREGIMQTRPEVHLKDIAMFNKIVATSLVRREHFDLAGGYELNIDVPEDWVLWATVLGRTGGRALHSTGALLHYRQHLDSRNVSQRNAQTIMNGRRCIARNLPDNTAELYIAAAEVAMSQIAEVERLSGPAHHWTRVEAALGPALKTARWAKRRWS